MDRLKGGIIGLTVGDALGVPVEFTSREYLKQKPVVDMIGYGTYNLPPGTWSDDSSLTFCLAESLLNGYNLEDISKNIVAWRDNSFWCTDSGVFDIGNQTKKSINILKKILLTNNIEKLNNLRDSSNERTNGNGSLMRIFPLFFYINEKSLQKQFEIIWDVSALTHPHILSALSCFFYLRFINYLSFQEKNIAFSNAQQEAYDFFKSNEEISDYEINKFAKLFLPNFKDLTEDEIDSDGYVIHSLEASIWTFLNSDSYKKIVLKAVNLGIDTDTNAAIAGSLAGFYYGFKNIPSDWVESIAKKDNILSLCDNLKNVYL